MDTPKVTVRIWTPVTPRPEDAAALAARPRLEPPPRPMLERRAYRSRRPVPGYLGPVQGRGA